MIPDQLPYASDKYYVMDLIEESRRSRTSLAWIERLHLTAVALMSIISITAGLTWLGNLGWGLGLGLGILSVIALIFGNLARVIIGDLYRQFQYREKFLLFLFHVGVVLVARYILGIQVWGVVFGILHIFLCLQAIDFVFYARLYAWSMFMVFFGCVFSPTPPEIGLVCIWFGLLLAAIRMGHVRFRVERYGQGHGADLRSTLHRSLGVIVGPPLAGYIAYLVAHSWLQPRTFKFSPVTVDPPTGQVSVSYGDVIWQSLVLVVIIVGLLAFLNYLEKKLRRRKSSVPFDEEGAPTTMRELRAPVMEDQHLEADHTAGPRERVITSFIAFCDRLARINFNRKEAETASEYLQRLSQSFGGIQQAHKDAVPTFDNACYSLSEISEEEANEFVDMIDRSISEIKTHLEEQRESRSQDS